MTSGSARFVSARSPACETAVRTIRPRSYALLSRTSYRSHMTMGSTSAADGRARVLVAEDDRSVRESLVMALGLEGYDIEAVSDGEQALKAVLNHEPDAVVLDVMMPFVDGLTVCRRLRARGVKGPILILTARHEIADRVSGLDAGADDYLVKPFALDELSARLRALLRRTSVTRHREPLSVD